MRPGIIDVEPGERFHRRLGHTAWLRPQGVIVPLSLQSRDIGDITVVKCGGRLVEGTEAATLKQYLNGRLPQFPYIVLDLADVQFLDSAGLGLLARLVTT